MFSINFFLIFIPILSIILIAVNLILAPHLPYKEKKTPFECGYHSFLQQNRAQFTISFFVFGFLFIIFDLEIVLLYPFGVSSHANLVYGLSVMAMFALIVTVGFVYELGKNALKINSRQYDLTQYITSPDPKFIYPKQSSTAVGALAAMELYEAVSACKPFISSISSVGVDPINSDTTDPTVQESLIDGSKSVFQKGVDSEVSKAFDPFNEDWSEAFKVLELSVKVTVPNDAGNYASAAESTSSIDVSRDIPLVESTGVDNIGNSTSLAEPSLGTPKANVTCHESDYISYLISLANKYGIDAALFIKLVTEYGWNPDIIINFIMNGVDINIIHTCSLVADTLSLFSNNIINSMGTGSTESINNTESFIFGCLFNSISNIATQIYSHIIYLGYPLLESLSKTFNFIQLSDGDDGPAQTLEEFLDEYRGFLGISYDWADFPDGDMPGMQPDTSDNQNRTEPETQTIQQQLQSVSESITRGINDITRELDNIASITNNVSLSRLSVQDIENSAYFIEFTCNEGGDIINNLFTDLQSNIQRLKSLIETGSRENNELNFQYYIDQADAAYKKRLYLFNKRKRQVTSLGDWIMKNYPSLIHKQSPVNLMRVQSLRRLQERKRIAQQAEQVRVQQRQENKVQKREQRKKQ